jgi:hypothetical protein
MTDYQAGQQHRDKGMKAKYPNNFNYMKGFSESIKNVGEHTALDWIKTGAVAITDIGQENVYMKNEFGMEFYFKAYQHGTEFYQQFKKG